MRLELKDLQSGRMHQVDAAGAFVGSDAARARILARGTDVGPLHARVYVKDGRWLIEDLGTGPGTLVGGARITGATKLEPGATFSVGGQRFQVLAAGSEKVDDLQALLAEIDGGAPRPGAVSASAPRPGAMGVGAVPTRAPVRSSVRPAAEPPAADALLVSSPDDASLGGVASSFAQALTTALRSYRRMCVSLVTRTGASLRAGVVEPQVEALGPLELVAWALPPALALSVATSLASAVAARGGISYFVAATVLGGLVGVVAAVVGSILWHPLVSFIVRVLGGTSDARQRTNAFVAQSAAAILLAAALFVGAVLAVVPFRVALAAAPTLAVGASSLAFLTWRVWGQRMGLGRAFDAVLAVFAILVVASGALSAYRALASPPGRIDAADRVGSELAEAAARLGESRRRLAEKPRSGIAEGRASTETARSSFAEYRRRRAAIDRAVRADSSLFERVDGLARRYAKLQRDTERVERELARRAKRRALPERQRLAKLQARTGADVDAIYELLARR